MKASIFLLSVLISVLLSSCCGGASDTGRDTVYVTVTDTVFIEVKETVYVDRSDGKPTRERKKKTVRRKPARYRKQSPQEEQVQVQRKRGPIDEIV